MTNKQSKAKQNKTRYEQDQHEKHGSPAEQSASGLCSRAFLVSHTLSFERSCLFVRRSELTGTYGSGGRPRSSIDQDGDEMERARFSQSETSVIESLRHTDTNTGGRSASFGSRSRPEAFSSSPSLTVSDPHTSARRTPLTSARRSDGPASSPASDAAFVSQIPLTNSVANVAVAVAEPEPRVDYSQAPMATTARVAPAPAPAPASATAPTLAPGSAHTAFEL